MAGTIGRAFKISKQQAQGYGYKPGMRPNPGVTTIAAVNGRGSYSARSAMQGRSRAARLGHARNATRQALTAADKAAFSKRMREARQRRKPSHRRNRSPGTATSPGVSTNRRSRMHRRTHRSGAKKTRRLRHLRKNRKASRKAAATTRRRPRRSRRKKASVRRAAPRRRRRRKAAARKATPRRAKRTTRRRRKKTTRRAAPRRRRRRKARKMSANRRSRRTTKRRSRRRKTSTRRAAPRRRRRRKARRHTANRRTKRTSRRRRHAKGYRSNRRHASRRRHSRKGKHVFRRNEGFVATLTGALKVGLIAGAGFAGHKAATKLVADMILDKVIGVPATPVTAPAAPAVSGLEVLQPYKRILAALLSGAVGVVAVNKLVKDAETKKIVIAGIAGSFLHTMLVDLLTAFGGASGGKVAAYLSGYDASSAYSLGASIMPHYQPVGEYFDSGVSGLGEYFESGVAGLGNYSGNPDIYQAQAGFGAMPDGNSMHVDPASDLDRELTLAEAAAGVGMLPSYEAQAGLGDFTGAGGRQAIPSRSTWVPGQSNPSVWAPVTSVGKPQSATAMVPAGILQTSGGQGVFG